MLGKFEIKRHDLYALNAVPSTPNPAFSILNTVLGYTTETLHPF